MKSLFLSFSIVVGLTVFSGAQEKAAWLGDYKLAAETAKAQNKSLLLLFTGDWIPICQQFDQKILNTDTFLEEISEHFVLVRLNFPEDNRLPKELAAQNQLLKDAYRIRGYPAIVLTDAEGRPFGLNGFQPVGPQDYVKQILEMHQVGQEKAELRANSMKFGGLEMARMMTEGIPDLPGNMAARFYGEEMKQVIEADPDDTLGKAADYNALLEDVEYGRAMQLLAKESKWDQMIELTDSYIEERELTGGPLQKALLNKSSVQDRMGSLRGRIESLLRVVDIEAGNAYGQEAQRQLDELRAEKLREEAEEP